MKEVSICFLLLILSFFAKSNVIKGPFEGGLSLIPYPAGTEAYYQCLGEGEEPNSRIFQVFMVEYQSDTNSIYITPSRPIIKFTGRKPYPVHASHFMQLPLISSELIPNPDLPCLTSPEATVIKLIYSDTFHLSLIDSSYYFVNERCCRFGQTNLIGFPSNLPPGIVTMTEITPQAQQSCNNAPVFDHQLPTIICVDELFEFSHTATDADGDQLVYEFFNPFNTPADFNTNGWIPPPFDPIPFKLPFYSFQKPFGQSAYTRLDALSGKLEIMPDSTGLYLFGVQVKEYRNGTLMGQTYHDFQINVAGCEPWVKAAIAGEDVLPGSAYTVSLCEETSLELTNQSTQRDYIEEFFWQFDIEGQQLVYDSWDLSLSFPGAGSYQGQLLLNSGGACADTADITVNVVTDIRADFSFGYDTCVAGPVVFTDQSYSEGAQQLRWLWQFGDGEQSTEANPAHLYQIPSDYDVQLKITDEFGCKDSLTQKLEWKPAPAIIILAPDRSEGCAPLDVLFENLSTPIDSSYDIYWQFSDGKEAFEISPLHRFEHPGTYSLYISITSPLGCSIDTTFNNWINASPPPLADFSWFPQQVFSSNPKVIFENRSENAWEWEWVLGEHANLFEHSPTYHFPDTGLQSITLVVKDQYGCTDSIAKMLDVVPHFSYYLPNAFTPNQDGKNDVFRAKGIWRGVKSFQMTIWNRWGEKVFEAFDPQASWDGRDTKTDKPLPTGVYYCRVNLTGPRGKKHEITQSVLLIN